VIAEVALGAASTAAHLSHEAHAGAPEPPISREAREDPPDAIVLEHAVADDYLQRTVELESTTVRNPSSFIVVPSMVIVPANSTSVWVDFVV